MPRKELLVLFRATLKAKNCGGILKKIKSTNVNKLLNLPKIRGKNGFIGWFPKKRLEKKVIKVYP